MFLSSFVRSAAVASMVLVGPVLAQDATPVPVAAEPAIKRTLLQRLELRAAGYETVLAVVGFAPNATAGRHSHPGPVSAFVIYGSLEVVLDGTTPMQLRTGESFTVPANTVRDERTAATGAKVLASFVVPKAAPLATPAALATPAP